MQLSEERRSTSPRRRDVEARGGSRQEPGKTPTALDKQQCQASTVEFEARNNDSSFSSDSDFDRNMDEMESEAVNTQPNKVAEFDKDKGSKLTNIIHEVIKEERYEESQTIGNSKSSPLAREMRSVKVVQSKDGASTRE